MIVSDIIVSKGKDKLFQNQKKKFLEDWQSYLRSLWADHVKTTDSVVLSEEESGSLMEWFEIN